MLFWLKYQGATDVWTETRKRFCVETFHFYTPYSNTCLYCSMSHFVDRKVHEVAVRALSDLRTQRLRSWVGLVQDTLITRLFCSLNFKYIWSHYWLLEPCVICLTKRMVVSWFTSTGQQLFVFTTSTHRDWFINYSAPRVCMWWVSLPQGKNWNWLHFPIAFWLFCFYVFFFLLLILNCFYTLDIFIQSVLITEPLISALV